MMTNTPSSLAQLSDQDVLARVRRAARDERCATAHLIALLVELDARRLYLGQGCSSLFTYCTQVLHLSDYAAYNRIEAARAVTRFPMILDLVESGAVTLTTVRLLSPHLTEAKCQEVLERAMHMSKRQVEVLVATLNPAPDVPTVVRKLPAPAAAEPVVIPTTLKPVGAVDAPSPRVGSPPCPPAQTRPPEIKPLTPERYKIQVTVSRQAYEKLRRAQDLLRHSVPTGDPAIILERALDVLVAELERTKVAMTPRPRKSRDVNRGSRHIPAAVKRHVWERDGGRCAFNGVHGRCTETGFLEYHHVVPFGDGGATSASNLELRCRS